MVYRIYMQAKYIENPFLKNSIKIGQKDEEFKVSFSYIENLIKASLGYMTRHLHNKKRADSNF